MDSCRKCVLASLKTLVLAVLLVAAAFTLYLYIGGFDDVAGLSLDDADLIVELDDVPDDENAFLTFMSATNYYSVASDWRIELNLDSSVECLTQRRREAESAENARNLANTMNYASNLLEAKHHLKGETTNCSGHCDKTMRKNSPPTAVFRINAVPNVAA